MSRRPKTPGGSINNFFHLPAEESVIGGLLLSEGEALHKIRSGLQPEDFHTDWARNIYRTICTLVDTKQPVDLITVTTEMERSGYKPDGIVTYIAGLTDVVPTSANIEYYADTVRQMALSRKLYQFVLTWNARLNAHPLEDNLTPMLNQLKSFSGGGTVGKGFNDLKQFHEEWLSSGMNNPYMTTGLESLDEKVRLQPDHMWVIGARPKTGKTSYVVDLLYRFAATNQGSGLFYSLEMSADRIMRKFAARAVPHGDYKRRLSGQDGLRTVTELLQEHAAKLYAMPITVVDNEHTIEGICASIRNEVAKNPEVKFIAIDYIELITTREKITGSVEIINHALRSLVALKNEVKRPIFLISQLRRRNEEFSSEPSMDELKGSGLIEQSADVILLLWEGTLTRAERDRAGETYRKIRAKLVQRDGPHGVLDFSYYPQQSRFTTWKFNQ